MRQEFAEKMLEFVNKDCKKKLEKTIKEVLGVKVDYFFRPFTVSLSGIEFRKKAKMTEKARKSVEQQVMDHVERYFEIEEIAGIERNASPLRREEIIRSREDVIKLVQEIRKDWGLGKDGITDVISLLENKGIKVIEFDAPCEFDGLSGTAGEDIVIVLNSNIQPTERKRFTALHELGHLIMNFDESVDEKAKEKLCHAFASEFLIPSEVFKDIIGDISKIEGDLLKPSIVKFSSSSLRVKNSRVPLGLQPKSAM